MKNNIFLDTNILIDYLRGKEESVQYLETLYQYPLISALTVAELFAGARAKEIAIIQSFINTFHIIPLTTEIAEKGGSYRQQYGKSHGTDLIDALIAASAENENAVLSTLNKKHFPMLKQIIKPY